MTKNESYLTFEGLKDENSKRNNFFYLFWFYLLKWQTRLGFFYPVTLSCNVSVVLVIGPCVCLVIGQCVPFAVDLKCRENEAPHFWKFEHPPRGKKLIKNFVERNFDDSNEMRICFDLTTMTTKKRKPRLSIPCKLDCAQIWNTFHVTFIIIIALSAGLLAWCRHIWSKKTLNLAMDRYKQRSL